MTIIRRKIIATVLGLLVVIVASTVQAQRLNKLIELIENDQPAFGVLSVSYTHLTLPTICSV